MDELDAKAGGAAPGGRRELEALHAIALASNRGLGARSVLDVAVEVIHATFGSSATGFQRYLPAQNALEGEVHRGFEHNPKNPAGTAPLGVGLNGAAASTRKPQLTNDYSSDERSNPDWRERRFKGAMAAPVVIGDELVGTICVASRDRTYDEHDLAVLANIGIQLGTALGNARLLEQLKKSEARHRTVVETAPNVFYESTPQGELRYISPKIHELTGHPRARFEGDARFLSSLVHPDDRATFLERLARLARPGERFSCEYRLQHQNGVDIVWVADHAQVRAPGEGETETLITGVLVDLSERKVLEAGAREQARLASLGELAAGVAHEVNNPLSGILSYAQLAKRYLLRPAGARGSLEEQLREPLEGILAEAERILEITKTLVSFARRPEKEAFRPLPAHELVHASLTIMKQRLKEDSIALEVDVPQDLPALRARGHELTQVLQNLITNARAALNERFPRWDKEKVLALTATRLPPDERSASGWVRVSVRDRGCGIAAENLPRIFVPFFTTKPQGTGLGLAVSHEIIAAHGGRLEVESKRGEGATFSFTVPAF